MTFAHFKSELERLGARLQTPLKDYWQVYYFSRSRVSVYFNPHDSWDIYFDRYEVTEITTFDEALAWITMMERTADPTPF
jgi:hypothetical protein